MEHQTSRDRLLCAISGEKPDHVPCCFMQFQGLQRCASDDFDYFDRQLALGLDVRVELPDVPIRFDPRVSVRTWKQQVSGEEVPELHRVYETPSGTLTTVVRQTPDWPHGDEVPLFDDFLVPRARKYLVTGPQDLAPLRHLLAPPNPEDADAFRESAAAYRSYARSHGLLLSGGWRDWRSDVVSVAGEQGGTMLGVDALMWLCGATAPLYWAFDEPLVLGQLIDLVAEWDLKRMSLMLEAGADLIMERAWYSGTDFWSPKLFRRFVVPILQMKASLVHEAGAKFGYVMTSGAMLLLDDLVRLGVDVLIGVDPVQGKGTDLQDMVDQIGGRMSLWGGVSAPMTVETGTPREIREAVQTAVEICGREGGFILSPVDNVFEAQGRVWQNVGHFVSAWQELSRSV